MIGFRINQAIAKTGYCSRRHADLLIDSGRVSLNGETIRNYHVTVHPSDKLAIDGKELRLKQFTYIAVNKPPGIVTTCLDEKGRHSILELLPPQLRHLRPVGRLDMYSEGLIIFTNDGKFTQKLTHPSFHMTKWYRVTVTGKVSPETLKQLRQGMVLEGVRTLPTTVHIVDFLVNATIFEIALQEGKNRQVRRMCQSLGHPVKRLVRIAIGKLQLIGIKLGSWRYLTDSEVKMLGATKA